MPYKTIDELPKQIRKLPKRAQKMFLEAFNAAYSHGYSEDSCFKIAWSVVKKKFKRSSNGKWVMKAKVKKPKKKKTKSATGDVYYYVDFVLATPEPDSNKEVFHKSFLELVGQELLGLKGDLEHTNTLDLGLPKDWIGKIVDTKVVNGEIYATAVLNPQHEYFDVVLELAKKGELGASIEVEYDDSSYYIDDSGYRVYVDGKPVGFAFTIIPEDENAYVYNVREKFIQTQQKSKNTNSTS